MVYFMPALFIVVTPFLSGRLLNILFLAFLVYYVTVISGFRQHSDVDYIGYVNIFSEVPVVADFTLSAVKNIYGEVGFLFLNSLVKSLGGDFYIVTFTAALISIFGKAYFASKLCKNSAFLLSAYLCFHFITTEFIELRWSIASTFCIISMYFYYFKNSFNLGFVFFALAVLFHYFSLVVIIIFLVSKFPTRFLIAVAVASFVISFFYSGRFTGLGVETPYDQFYLMRRLFRYLNDPESKIGYFSFLRLGGYIFLILVALYIKPSGAYLSYGLIKLALSCLTVSIVFTIVPILYYRSMIFTDLICLAVLLLLVSSFSPALRLCGLMTLSIPLMFWCYFDYVNTSSSGKILPYTSWII